MKPANPIINTAHSLRHVTRNNRDKFAFVLSLGLIVGSAALCPSGAFAQTSTIEQALPPTSLAHATLSREEAATLTPAHSSQPAIAIPSVPTTVQPDTMASASVPMVSTSPTLHKSPQAALTPVTYVQPNSTLSPTPPTLPAVSDTTPSAVIQNATSSALPSSPMAPLPTESPITAPSSNLAASPAGPVVQNSGAPTSMAHATLTQSELPPGNAVSGLSASTEATTTAVAPTEKVHVSKSTHTASASSHSVPAKAPTTLDALPPPPSKPSPLPDVSEPTAKMGEQEAQQTENSLKDSALMQGQISTSAQTEELIKQWEDKLEILEKENIALRDKLQFKDTDKLSDIKVDTVNQIREDVLRARVIELEKQLDKMRMEGDPNNSPDVTKPINSDAAKTIQKAATPVPPPPPSSGKSGGETSMFGR